jgi:hypothetical protein
MKVYQRHIFVLIFTGLLFFTGCNGSGQFASFNREYLGKVQIGASASKEVVLQNPYLSTVQHIVGLNFDTGTNSEGHFRIDKVEVGGVVQNPRDKDISVPAGSILQIYVTYQPLNLETTVADYGGWSTGGEERYIPSRPEDSAADAMKSLLGKAESDEEVPTAVQRSIISVVYDYPQKGIYQIEMVGEAEIGPNGETSAGGISGGDCPSDTGILCYKGGFGIELPDIMNTGPVATSLTGPIVFSAAGSNLTLDMAKFPAALLVLKGNGPGEPLEGKPINAISIVISGTEGVSGSGTFDGSRLKVNGVSFRIRVILGEIKIEDINPGLQAAVDFNVGDLTIETVKPYTNGSITMTVETVLAKEPSGNPMFDQFLGGTTVRVTMDGQLISQ